MIPYIIWAERRVTHTHTCGVRDGALVLALEAIDVKQDRQHLSLSSDSGQWTTCIAVHNVVSAKPSAFTTAERPSARSCSETTARLGECVDGPVCRAQNARGKEEAR